MKYQEPTDASWSDVKAAVLRQDADALLHALVGAVHSQPGWRRAQDECLRLTEHPDLAVRRVAVTCLGHVARIHRRIDRATVLKRLEAMSSDPEIAGYVQDARDDIEQFTT